MSSYSTILTHDVEDYAAWRRVFDAGEALRAKHGVEIQGVHTAADNPNRVTVIAKLASPSSLQSFMSDPEAGATMSQAGVIGQPIVQMLVAAK